MPFVRYMHHLTSIVFIVICDMFLAKHFNLEFLLTEEYATWSLPMKYGYALVMLKLKIFKYYTAFCLIDSATIASGLMYNGIDEKTSKPYQPLI